MQETPMDDETRSSLEQQLQIYRRNVQYLERQVASYGGEDRSPLALLNDLQTNRAKVAEIQSKLDPQAGATAGVLAPASGATSGTTAPTTSAPDARPSSADQPAPPAPQTQMVTLDVQPDP